MAYYRHGGHNDRRKIPVGVFFFILMLIGGGGELISALGAIMSLIIFVGVLVAIVVLITKFLKKNGYSEMNTDRYDTQNRENKNPYSSTYNTKVNTPDMNVQRGQTPPMNGNYTNNYTNNYNNNSTNNYTNNYTTNNVNQTTTSADRYTVNKSKEEVKPKEPERKSTGDAQIDKMIEDRDLAIKEMHRLNDAIEDEKLSEQIEHLEVVTDKIVNYVVEHPKKKKQVRKFFDYYLPTTMKLLNAYDRMDEAGISGTNIDGTKSKVEDMMDTALAAFDKQLDSLYDEEALDISTDISVMENMLKAEGLTEDDLMKAARESSLAMDADPSISLSMDDIYGGFGASSDDEVKTSN